jgi:membrane associated rhomboid family serine protease
MIALYSFGENLEDIFSIDCVFGRFGKIFFLVLYLTAFVVASLPDYFRYKHAHHFRSLGASGAVSAVIFSMLIFFPQTPIGLIFLPIRVPGYIFAIIYLGITVYLDRRGGGNINHSAHFWGAAYGIVFTLVCCRLFANYFDVYDNFFTQLKSSSAGFTLICDY